MVLTKERREEIRQMERDLDAKLARGEFVPELSLAGNQPDPTFSRAFGRDFGVRNRNRKEVRRGRSR